MFEYIQKQRVINPPKFESKNTEIWARAFDDEASVKVWSKTFEEYRRYAKSMFCFIKKTTTTKPIIPPKIYESQNTGNLHQKAWWQSFRENPKSNIIIIIIIPYSYSTLHTIHTFKSTLHGNIEIHLKHLCWNKYHCIDSHKWNFACVCMTKGRYVFIDNV